MSIKEKEYVVTLHRKDDLENFYGDMQNYHLIKKRPLSRNTHYRMTPAQAELLKQDSRVLDVELADNIKFVRKHIVNKEPYVIAGDHWKNSPVATTFDPLWHQWGHLHCAGDQVQRRKTTWGDPTGTEVVNDNLEVFSNGKHVDVVIVDDPISYDSGEWWSPTLTQTRFVQYQWFNELNSLVNSIDDDNQTEPSGVITYGDNASTSQYHGNHVAGTAAGGFYGWAREANIYNIAVTDPWPSGQQVGSLLIFDYLRAFHRAKPVNPETGFKNPTVTNHSYGGIIPFSTPTETLEFSDLNGVFYQGVTYNAGSPGPSGWTEAGVEADFGVRFGLEDYPSYSSSVRADVEDAIEEGIVIVGSAGNDNLLVASPGDVNWDNYIIMSQGSYYYNRGAWPNSPDTGGISVGALQDHSEFRRSTYSNFGPGVDVFAPGDLILSAYGNTGFNDSKYAQGSANFYRAISGTSMASPQVAGIIACQASGRERYSHKDAVGYIQKTSLQGDMTFDLFGGGLDDNTCRQGSPNAYVRLENPRPSSGYISPQIGDRSTGMVYPRTSTFFRPIPGPPPPPPPFPTRTFQLNVGNSGASHYTISGADAQNAIFPAENDPTINCYVGDTLEFDVDASGHPFLIKTSATTGTGDQVTTGTITGNGAAVGTVTWDTTGVTPGTYYYICQFHSGMVGQIVIAAPTGYPTYASRLGSWLSSSYITTVGIDRNGVIENTLDMNFNFNVGDIVKFKIDAIGHPTWIKTTDTTGTGDAVTSGIISNNGTENGIITWDTAGVQPGTYYYQCEVHGSMDGQIIIS